MTATHPKNNKVNILGVKVDAIRVQDVLEHIHELIVNKRRGMICHTHVMGLNIAYENAWFRDFLNAADLVYCDGAGVRFGAALLGSSLPERFTLADWVYPLAESIRARGHSLYLLGNPPGSAERAAQRLSQLYPGLQIAGTWHGFFDKTPGSPENEAVVADINRLKPDIVLIGFGMPAQEKWLKDNWERLEIHVGFPCGALFEYIAGDLRRGPRWMTENNLEWLARMWLDPKRYTRRYFRDNPLFLYRLLKQRLTGISHAV